MPKEISFEEIDDRLLGRTLEVRSKNAGDFVKFKFRTIKHLYTVKVESKDADKVINLVNDKSIDIIPVEE